MSGRRVSDPSKLHLKRELTQIRKAARVLRDPGTTSSWKSPLNSSRSITAVAEPPTRTDGGSQRHNGNTQLDSIFQARAESSGSIGNVKEKRVFLYNWKTQKSSSEKSGLARNGDDEDVNDGSSWIQGSVDDDDYDAASDAKNCDEAMIDSTIFRCRDTNPESPGVSKTRKNNVSKRKSKRNSTHLDFLSKYQSEEAFLDRESINSTRLASSRHAEFGLGVRRDDSAEFSDETEDYCNSEDLGKITGASPLLLKLKPKNWSRSSTKFLKGSRKDDSSYTYNSTPALSTSSYNVYGVGNPSTIRSWGGTTSSLNEGDDELDHHLDFPARQGCGIPCYWTKKTVKHRGGCRSCCSPSLSDTLRRTGSSILCGSQSVYRRHRQSSGSFDKQKIASRSAQGVLPLLTYSADGRRGSSIGTGGSDDELSTNFGELDLEAQSRLDGQRWSTSCKSQVGLEVVAVNRNGEERNTPEKISSLSQKYKPMFFDELIGQSLVVQSLMNAIKKSKIAPVYLFQGPRGTGKTSTARIFAAALNCVATEETKPCGYCKECTDFISGKSRDLWELDGTNDKGADKIRHLLKTLLTILPPGFSRYKVFVVNECHLLPSKTWLSFLKFLENPPQKVVFIFMTADLDSIPRTIQSRCQKYLFNKLKDADIVAKLGKIASDENLDIEPPALDLIALYADGSLRDAETMLEQLSLLGKRITASLINELVGVVSDDKLLELLELAMSPDTAETVKRARELLDLGADPLVLMSHMATLIMDIIAGTYKVVDEKCSSPFFGEQNLTEADLGRLKHALKLLSEAEKQLRVSNDRSTWFTATLLQLGSLPSPGTTHTGSSTRQSFWTNEDDPSSISREAIAYTQRLGLQFRNSTSPTLVRKADEGVMDVKLSSEVEKGYKSSWSSQIAESGTSIASHDNGTVSTMMLTCRNSEKLNDIWIKCIERCHSKTLRQLLYTHGKLLSINEVEGSLVAYIAFGESDIKLRAERLLSSITNSIEMVLRRNIEVRIILLPETELLIPHQTRKIAMINKNRDQILASGSNVESPCLSDPEVGTAKESRQDIPMQRIKSVICEQRLETAWLQVTEKGTAGSLRQSKPERNQVLPQEHNYLQHKMDSATSSGPSSQHWMDGVSNEVTLLKIGEAGELHDNQTATRTHHRPLSPSLLHDNNFINNIGYDSGSGDRGCSKLLCWNTIKTQRRSKVKGTPLGSRRSRKRRFSLFSGCVMPRKTEGKFGK